MKVALADVLWEAANVWLWNGHDHGVNTYSCGAVGEAAFRAGLPTRLSVMRLSQSFLASLGCPTYSTDLTFGTDSIFERQARRYMWLLLAMHVAEDEQIMLETDDE